MQKTAVDKYSIFTYFRENYSSYLKRSPFTIKRQMPIQQIRHFIKQAVRKQVLITVQLNPTTHKTAISECTGVAAFSPNSSQIVLTGVDNKTVYLINSDQIRHIRLCPKHSN